jgi:hypothetical protein
MEPFFILLLTDTDRIRQLMTTIDQVFGYFACTVGAILEDGKPSGAATVSTVTKIMKELPKDSRLYEVTSPMYLTTTLPFVLEAAKYAYIESKDGHFIRMK